MSFFTFPLEAFAETFLTEGALTVPTLTETVGGISAIGSTVAVGAAPSIISSQFGHPMKRRSGKGGTPPPIKRARLNDLYLQPQSLSNPLGGGTMDTEVPVKPIPKAVALTAPGYFTIDLPYSEVFVHSAARAGVGVDVVTYRLNSIYDPDATGGGTKQPMGRDTWASVYKYYRVLKTHIRVFVQNQQNNVETAAAKNALIVGLEWTDDNSPTGLAASKEAFLETKHVKESIVVGRDNSPANHHVFTFDYSPETWTDHVQNASIATRWTAISSSPAENHYIVLRHFPLVGDTTATNLIFRVDIKYTVQFTELQHSVFKTTH